MTALPRTILVATDNSKQSMLAVEYAVEISALTGAALHVVHVGWLSPWLYPVRLSEQQVKTLEGEAQNALDQAVDQVKKAGGPVGGAHLRIGRTDGEVITLAEELGAELILVGARGRDSIPRIPLGPDSENIVKHDPARSSWSGTRWAHRQRPVRSAIPPDVERRHRKQRRSSAETMPGEAEESWDSWTGSPSFSISRPCSAPPIMSPSAKRRAPRRRVTFSAAATAAGS